ncbi:MAG: hypothetical protein QOG61_2161 [Candidatus Binataceae bacterium]|nr:hypothetical protein [Candidatus Binataceae bacterium]
MSQRARLCRGDLVEVKPPDEIVQTLDADGASDHLPFMPEMLEFCGRRFRVSRRVFTICFSGGGSPRGFSVDDVVTLESVRCSGVAHDGCQKACMIFWREAWLRKVEDTTVQSQLALRGVNQLRARLKVSSGPKVYYCQASELSKATHHLSRWEKWRRYLSGLHAGNFNALQMAQSIGIWLFWLKIRRMFLGVYARGSGNSTPAAGLNLQPGEWVEVKSMQSILETLNERGDNRGLHFSPDMRLWCGRRCRVKGRLDKIIVDGTGQMRQLRNTVCLEGSTCGCSYMGSCMGGCSRSEFTYWREIWLRRSDGHSDPPGS